MKYKLEWEMVSATKLYKYSNADPMYYKNTMQVVPNSQIPDEDWKLISKEVSTVDEVMDQYETLKMWASEDRQFVRNVKLYRLVDEPRWEEV